MASRLLGRTNQTFSDMWLTLVPPPNPEDTDTLVDAARTAGTVLDISVAPALWGGRMRGEPLLFLANGARDYERATDSTHAIDLIQANLIQILSSIGRETLDFYLLPVRRTVEEFQISGALEALESARQDGHIRWLGLRVEDPPLASMAMWQFHDAFDIISPRRNASDTAAYDMLSPLAAQRRVGVVTYDPFPAGFDPAVARELAEGHPVLAPVNHAAQITALMEGVS